MKKSFVLYQDQYEPIKGLTQEQKGCLLDAMFLYQIGEPIPEGDPVVMMAFSFFKQTFERDNDKYLKRCEKNRENVRKRWGTKDTNVYDGIRTDTKHTDSGSDKIVTVIEDSDSDIKEKEHLPASGHHEVEKAEKKKPANKSMEEPKNRFQGKCPDEYNEEFEAFWNSYPKRNGQKAGKRKAFESWWKVLAKGKFEPGYLVDRINVLKESYGEYPVNASVWLNNARWEDEYTPPVELDSRGLPVEFPYEIDMDVIKQLKAERKSKEDGLS